jgi:hypothetical protein
MPYAHSQFFSQKPGQSSRYVLLTLAFVTAINQALTNRATYQSARQIPRLFPHVLLRLFYESRFAALAAKAVSLAVVIGAGSRVFDSDGEAREIIVVLANAAGGGVGCFRFRRWSSTAEEKRQQDDTKTLKQQSHGSKMVRQFWMAH